MMCVIDEIEYDKEMRNELIGRLPQYDTASFRIGSLLIVHERQAAVFYFNGKALDIFGPGQHVLTVDNIPLLISSIGESFKEEEPFFAEIYYVSTRKFSGRDWGTPISILVGDPYSSVPLLRAFGNFSYCVSDLQRFVGEFAQQGVCDLRYFERGLRNSLVAILSQVLTELGKSGKSGVEIIGSSQEITDEVLNRAQNKFDASGLTLEEFNVVSIFPTPNMAEELQALGIMPRISTDEADVDKDSQSSVSNTIYVDKGEFVMGEKIEVKLGDNATFHGDFAVAKLIENSFNKATSANMPDELKELLRELSGAVGEMCENLPKEVAKQIARDLETLTTEATSDTPRRKWWELSIEELKTAAKNVGEIGKPVVDLATRIALVLSKI